jgi:hypothetical protein
LACLGDRSHVDFESLLKKSLYSFCSVGSFRTPHQIGDVPIYNFSSANSIVRTMYEGSVAMRYLFCLESEDLATFWHSVWRLNGHLQRDKLKGEYSMGIPAKTYAEAFPDELAINERLTKEYMTRLQATSKYQSLDEHRKKAACKGQWKKLANSSNLRDVPWHEMAEEVGLARFFGKVGYNFGCSYVHSDAISAFQISEALHPAKQLESVYTALSQATALHAHAMESFFIRYPQIRQEPSHQRAHDLLQWWLERVTRSG